MSNKCFNRGFTFVEILVVLAIMLILVAVSVMTFSVLGDSSALRVTTQDVYTTLTEARSRTLASDGDIGYGVHFDTNSVTLFEGASYNVSDPDNVVYAFTGATYATSTLITENVNIVFERLTGLPSTSGTVYIVRGDTKATSTIVIHDSGLIEN